MDMSCNVKIFNLTLKIHHLVANVLLAKCQTEVFIGGAVFVDGTDTG